MRTTAPVKRSLAVAAAVVLTGWAGLAPAAANPGNGNGNGAGQETSSEGNGQGKGNGQAKNDDKGKGRQQAPNAAPTAKPEPEPKPEQAGQGKAPGNSGAKPGKGPKDPKPGKGPKDPRPGNPNPGTPGGNSDNAGGNGNGPKPGNASGNAGAKGPKPGNAGGNGDPAGNNGTIKIAQLGEADGTPDNNPHPGCRFQIEWYGFDEGDYWSQVSFVAHAPTADAVISGTEPSRVFVGEDPASGAGTATGLDAVQGYTLGFTGTPHPKQGYHVKVTVATPFSQGNDTKSKVFWVQPCDQAAAPTTPGTEAPGTETPGTDSETPAVDTGTVDTGTAMPDAGVLEIIAGLEEGNPIAGVLGIQASATDAVVAGAAADEVAVRAAAGDDDAAVPTAVDAGGDNPVVDLVTSPVPLAIVGLGLVLGTYALLRRRQGA
ncbi:hypothetical protein [Nocardioides sp. SYSU DS0663]|uniref:hypothetical protein n=1 Tax=Nocardioides sp. SYSU DS0663 TaxID=3416445 RepID=UPI003F4B06DE